MEYFWQPLIAPSLVIIAAALLLGVAMLRIGFYIEQRNRGPHPPACPRCKYNMAALSQLDCPECGHAVADVEDWKRRRRRVSPVLRTLAAIILLYAFVMLCFAAAYTLHIFRVDSLTGRASVEIDYPEFFRLHRRSLWITLFERQIPFDAATPMPWTQRANSVNFRFAPPTDDDLRHLASFNDSVEYVNIEDCSLLTNAGLATFRSAPRLEELSLDSIRLDDVGMQSLADAPHLKQLLLYGAHIEGNAISKLARAKELFHLSVGSSVLRGDEALKGLASCPSLRTIAFYDCNIMPAALVKLDGAPALIQVGLMGSTINDEHIKALASMKNLHLDNLHLDKSTLTDACVESLGSIRTLTWVSLADTHITDDGLKKLAGCSKITTIIVSESNCSQAVVDAINKVAPGRVIRQR